MGTNLELVQKGFHILHPWLAGYICQELQRESGEQWWSDVLMTLSEHAQELPDEGDYATLVDSLDIANCLRLFDRKWNDIFRKKLSIDYRTWSKELMGVRNKVAHAGLKDFLDNDTWRALDTMARLCEPFDAEATEAINSLLRQSRYGSAEGSTQVIETQVATKDRPVEGILNQVVSGLPSWRDVIQPHPDVAQGRYKNAEFAANSQTYKDVAAEVDREAATKGITLSAEERKAKINEKLSQISATTSNANEKRAIDSYLSRESVISEYNSSVLTGNKDALAKVDAEADMKTKKIVEQEIKDKGLENVITDATKKAELKNNAIIEVSKQISAVGGDLSKITFSDEAKAQIQKNIKAKAEIEIQNKGGINNISLSQTAETELKNQLLSITQANPNLQSSDISQIEQKLRTEAVTKQVEQSVTQEVVQKQMMDEEYKKQVSSHLYEEKKDDVRNSVREEAKIAAANKIAEGVMNYEEGRIRGNHTNNADGSLDQVYNAEYAQNEKISNDGVKTKSAEDLAWDKIKKAVLDKDKK